MEKVFHFLLYTQDTAIYFVLVGGYSISLGYSQQQDQQQLRSVAVLQDNTRTYRNELIKEEYKEQIINNFLCIFHLFVYKIR